MALSVIIPTKNRLSDLLETTRSLLVQTRPPDELIVVDQSAASESGIALTRMLKGSSIPRFVNIWDPSITGLTMARNVGFSECTGDIVCYLDDDTTPAPDYLAMVEKGFGEFPKWAGICGRVTESVSPSKARRLASSLFRFAIFRDNRAGIGKLFSPTEVRLLPGAAFSFRREVLDQFRFDERLTGYGLGEDVDFCLRAGTRFRFGAYLRAEVHHRRSQAERPDASSLRGMARLSAKRLWQSHRRHIGDDLAYAWLRFGFGAEQLLSQIAYRAQIEGKRTSELGAATRVLSGTLADREAHSRLPSL